MRALFGILLFGLTALVAGFVGFQAGVASNIASAGGVVWLGWFPGFGFLFFLLFLGFLVFAFGGRRRHAWGPGMGHPMGRGSWSSDPGQDDPRRQWIVEAHRRLHEEEAARATGTRPAAPTPPSAPAAGAAGPGDSPTPPASTVA